MNGFKTIHFDLFLAKIKAQTKDKVYDFLVHEMAPLAETDAEVLHKVFQKRLKERTFGMGEGIAIFDVKSSHIKKPVIAIANFDHEIDFNALDDRPAHILAAVISPSSDGAMHLQRLAGISRLLRNKELSKALREARNVDEMRVLFMPSQDWMIAA